MTTVVTLSNRLEPSARAFLETVNSSGDPPIYQLPVSDARGVLSGAQSGPVEKMDARIEDHVIKSSPHGEISIRIVRPSGCTGELPVVMYLHGGGWVLGDKETHPPDSRDCQWSVGGGGVRRLSAFSGGAISGSVGRSVCGCEVHCRKWQTTPG